MNNLENIVRIYPDFTQYKIQNVNKDPVPVESHSLSEYNHGTNPILSDLGMNTGIKMSDKPCLKQYIFFIYIDGKIVKILHKKSSVKSYINKIKYNIYKKYNNGNIFITLGNKYINDKDFLCYDISIDYTEKNLLWAIDKKLHTICVEKTRLYSGGNL